ncbi:MAG: cytochrome c3 family protein [Candidatus Solibacter sp.]|nr:cytochrome c3 family protein [Candidatus Solibacter sp.]
MKRTLLRGGLVAAAVIIVLALPAGSLYYEYNAGASCARCHEIRKNYDAWHASSHRDIACGACHGEITTLDAGFHLGNLRRLVRHVRQGFQDPVRLGTKDIPRLMERCRSCHRQEFAQWQTGAHSATYGRLFLDEKHNRGRLLMDDCLRCHGMHFEGGIGDLVAPVDAKGPWRLLRPELADQPAIPCLSCHQVHREGELLPKAARPFAAQAARSAAKQEVLRPSVGLFDRREQRHFPVELLPLPAMRDGARAVKISPDTRQALCYQCHAPLAAGAVGSGDDRTPVGVHEGLSCLACHLKHGQQTRASCANCHPRLSNCGLDVEKMDTSFVSTASSHNVHFVKCADCHPKGIPPKRAHRAGTR